MKICVIATVWFPLSHADVIVSRWIAPFPGDERSGWSQPDSVIASVYLAQRPGNDIGGRICEEAGVPLYGTIREALTLGGGDIAVDAVLLIGEHGDYPLNEYGQKLYPRKKFFDAIVETFCEMGRCVPIFNDKHLSWSFEESAAMIKASRKFGFPLAAGSSLSICPVSPGRVVHKGDSVDECIAIFSGCPDHYGFHIIEIALSQIAHRRGGEMEILEVRTLDEGATRDAILHGEISEALLLQGLRQAGYPDEQGVVPLILSRVTDLFAYQFQFADGLLLTCLHLPTFISEWIVAVKVNGGELRSCVVQGGGAWDFFSNFARLNRRVNEFFLTGVAPTPLEYTHLAAGALEAAHHARKSPNQWHQTSHLTLASIS